MVGHQGKIQAEKVSSEHPMQFLVDQNRKLRDENR